MKDKTSVDAIKATIETTEPGEDIDSLATFKATSCYQVIARQ